MRRRGWVQHRWTRWPNRESSYWEKKAREATMRWMKPTTASPPPGLSSSNSSIPDRVSHRPSLNPPGRCDHRNPRHLRLFLPTITAWTSLMRSTHPTAALPDSTL